MSPPLPNPYLDGPLGPTYVKTALPIIFVMGTNGLLAVVDALFLGHFVGPEALAAVTLMFPATMLVIAAATLVSNGMSSILARHLGGRRISEARAVFAGAHGLALVVAGALIVLLPVVGGPAADLASAGSQELARMGLVYLRLAVLFSPVLFLLSVNSDALRNEGRVGFMAAMSLLVSLANVGFDYVLIALLGMGVAGSVVGTVLAQSLALGIIVAFRVRGATVLRPSALVEHSLMYGWRRILALGAPQSLGFIGLALGSAAIMITLQLVGSASYGSTVSAYGIVTRIMTFAYLPLLGLSQAMQTITGNNYGAARWDRSNASLRTAIIAALIYCAAIQLVLSASALRIGAAFVSDPVVIAEVGRILPVVVMMFTFTGPLMMIAAHFQAIGEARRAALLSLAKPYLFAVPLTFVLASTAGEWGIWRAGPIAEIMLLGLTAGVLARAASRGTRRWGLFQPVAEARS